MNLYEKLTNDWYYERLDFNLFLQMKHFKKNLPVTHEFTAFWNFDREYLKLYKLTYNNVEMPSKSH